MKKEEQPQNWKGICKKCWDRKQKGYILKNGYPFDDEHCWSCGKRQNWREAHHKLERFGGKVLN